MANILEDNDIHTDPIRPMLIDDVEHVSFVEDIRPMSDTLLDTMHRFLDSVSDRCPKIGVRLAPGLTQFHLCRYPADHSGPHYWVDEGAVQLGEEMTMATQTVTIRAKMRVGNVQEQRNQDGSKYAETVTMHAVTSDTEENKQWSQATPSGQISLFISNPGAWGKLPEGTEFLIDFIPVG